MKFFHKLRQKVLKQKRFGRYLLYAIGEIILVVIGILLAIQLNNLKNENDINKRQKAIIEQLKTDLSTSLVALKSARQWHENAAIQTNYILHAYWKPELQHDSLSYNILDVLNFKEQYRPTTGTIESLVSSGNIELIKSIQLRNSMLQYLDKANMVLDEMKVNRAIYFLSTKNDITTYFSPMSFKRSYERKTGHVPKPKNEKEKAYQPFPDDFKEVPFPVTLKEIFSNRHIFHVYQGISIGHRNFDRDYKLLINETNSLLRILDQEGY